jgi:hypothetical protein
MEDKGKEKEKEKEKQKEEEKEEEEPCWLILLCGTPESPLRKRFVSDLKALLPEGSVQTARDHYLDVNFISFDIEVACSPLDLLAPIYMPQQHAGSKTNNNNNNNNNNESDNNYRSRRYIFFSAAHGFTDWFLLDRANTIIYFSDSEERCFRNCILNKMTPYEYKPLWDDHARLANQFLEQVTVRNDSESLLDSRVLIVDVDELLSGYESEERAGLFHILSFACGVSTKPNHLIPTLTLMQLQKRLAVSIDPATRNSRKVQAIRRNAKKEFGPRIYERVENWISGLLVPSLADSTLKDLYITLKGHDQFSGEEWTSYRRIITTHKPKTKLVTYTCCGALLNLGMRLLSRTFLPIVAPIFF